MDEGVRLNLEIIVERFPVGSKVVYNDGRDCGIFEDCGFAHVVGYQYDGYYWLLCYHRDFDGHSGIHEILNYKLEPCETDEIDKKYGGHCWWVLAEDVERVD